MRRDWPMRMGGWKGEKGPVHEGWCRGEKGPVQEGGWV